MITKDTKILIIMLVFMLIPAFSFGKTSYSGAGRYQASSVRNSSYSQNVRKKSSGIYCKCVITANKRICYMMRQ